MEFCTKYPDLLIVLTYSFALRTKSPIQITPLMIHPSYLKDILSRLYELCLVGFLALPAQNGLLTPVILKAIHYLKLFLIEGSWSCFRDYGGQEFVIVCLYGPIILFYGIYYYCSGLGSAELGLWIPSGSWPNARECTKQCWNPEASQRWETKCWRWRQR